MPLQARTGHWTSILHSVQLGVGSNFLHLIMVLNSSTGNDPSKLRLNLVSPFLTLHFFPRSRVSNLQAVSGNDSSHN